MLMECINEKFEQCYYKPGKKFYCQLVEMMKENGQAGERSETLL